MSTAAGKLAFSGVVTGVQPRIRLMRSFDERSHTYLGYVLRVRGADDRELLVAIGEAAHAKHQLRAGDSVSGEGVPVADPRIEIAAIYRVSKLRVLARGADGASSAPPWRGVPPELPVYRARGHRRLDARTYESVCTTCRWGCRMPVELVVDPWGGSASRHRMETFCYGPLSCALYRAGPPRKVPGRRGMSWTEEDWVDEEAVRHRGPDE
jgi:hypothetical protein